MITAPYDTFEDAIKLAQSDLEYEGKGHTASIHSMIWNMFVMQVKI